MKQSINLFIGGAGDFERFYVYGPRNFILKEVKIPVDKIIQEKQLSNYQSIYLSYKDLKKDSVWNLLPNYQDCTINLIGYSLGGWNAAHLATLLTKRKYEVTLLITLDPVGKNARFIFHNDLFFNTPQPNVAQWINVSSVSKKFSIDNLIAIIGGRWIPESGPKFNIKCTHSHVEVGKMFFNPTTDNDLNFSHLLLNCIEGN